MRPKHGKRKAPLYKRLFAPLLQLCKAVGETLAPVCGKALAACGRLVRSDLKIRISAAASCLCIMAAGTVTAYGLNLKYGVSYLGNTVGYVAEKQDVDKAVKIAVKLLNCENAFDYIGEVNCFPTAGGGAVSSNEQIAKNILGSTKGISKCAVLTVNGNEVLYAKNASAIKKAMDKRLASCKKECEEQTVEFADTLKTFSGYCPTSEMADSKKLSYAMEILKVKTFTTEKYTEVVPYETLKKETDRYEVGFERVYTSGQNGTREITAKVAYIDGVEQSREIVARHTVVEPVSEIIVVGTKPKQDAKVTSSSRLIWPLQRKSGEYISSYFGDGRGHKGWDIATEAGTSIYAVRSGTVTRAGWDSSGYGYCIEINHGNEFSTLYAHCSAIYVRAGESVTAGKCIGAVGKTGHASGNHLHFETRVGGTPKNPASFY